MVKKSFNKRSNLHCPKCRQVFTGERYLKQHLNKKHNEDANNNNNKLKKIKKTYKNKNLFKRFITFIMKIIMAINNEIEIRNYIGDRLERQKAIYDLTHNVPDKKLIKKLVRIEDGESDADDDDFIDDLAKDDSKLFSGQWGSDIDKKVNELKRRENVKAANKRRAEEINNKKYAEMYDFFSQFNTTPKKEKNEYEKIKIKRNIIEAIKDQKKEKIEKSIKDKIEDNIKVEVKKEEIIQPIIDYEADFLYPKISARELFIRSFPDKEMKDFAIDYINKYWNDCPTDDEIREAGDLIYSHYTRVLSGNGFYARKFDELRQKLLEYFANGGESFRCEYCGKYTQCKRRHCLHCKKFLEELGNDPEQLILKNYLEKNYKKIKIQETNLILSHFEGQKPEDIKKFFPHYIKFQGSIRRKWIKKYNKKREIAEKLGVKISELPPIRFNTGLAKKLFKEITNFTNKKK